MLGPDLILTDQVGDDASSSPRKAKWDVVVYVCTVCLCELGVL